jgi:hypothetical protein
MIALKEKNSRDHKNMSKETKPIPDDSAKATPQMEGGASLAVLSVPGGTQTDSELADKHRKDANVEVSPEGAFPVISVPGGS